ncbi:hypothetical protein QQ020_23295 [Fulvivirgaceae bacterium BMA12]|uniref:Uncharacterized protein n=1 Tax=Agaribacillus aureus TaxID=3051825 RepID=A0ABT8LCT5_9BACT|nr:hypothetical protein [Fulvivirgaceae bacterium BMA12]
MELGKNKTLIGFVDLLTGFLASALVLMLIFSYSLNKGGDIAGGPRDYILYQVEVQGNDVERLKVQLFVKPPNAEWLETIVNQSGNPIVNSNHFLALDSQKFYAWGPARVFDENGQIVAGKVVYNIYGVSLLDSPGKWEVGILLYDRTDFDKYSYKELSDKDYGLRIKKSYKVKHVVNTRTTRGYIKNDLLNLGNFSDVSVNVERKRN